MDYIFIGGTYRGYKLLNHLLNAGHIPDYVFILKEDNHEKKKYSEDIKALVTSLDIPFQIKKKISKEDEIIFTEKKRDFAIVCGWRTIINFELSINFKLGLLAAHDSLLPEYRGFAPLNWAIINGETDTGVTLFQINEGEVDSGDILNQVAIKILPDDHAQDVYEKITDATVELVDSFMKSYINSSYTLAKQDQSKATYTCKRTPIDGLIDWHKSSQEVYNLIRALAPPYPCAYTFYDKEKYYIRKAEIGEYNKKKYVGRIVGRVVRIDDSGVEILCGQGSIKIIEWESESDNKKGNPNLWIKSYATTL